MIRLKFYYMLVEYTSLPLLLCFYLSYISGKGLVRVELVRSLTLGIISYPESILLHTIWPLNFVFAILVVVHSVSGLNLLVYRRVKSKRLKIILEALTLFALGVPSLIFFILLEI